LPKATQRISVLENPKRSAVFLLRSTLAWLVVAVAITSNTGRKQTNPKTFGNRQSSSENCLFPLSIPAGLDLGINSSAQAGGFPIVHLHGGFGSEDSSLPQTGAARLAATLQAGRSSFTKVSGWQTKPWVSLLRGVA